MMGRFGAPSWVKLTSVPDQRLIYPLGGALRYLSSRANRTQGVQQTIANVMLDVIRDPALKKYGIDG